MYYLLSLSLSLLLLLLILLLLLFLLLLFIMECKNEFYYLCRRKQEEMHGDF